MYLHSMQWQQILRKLTRNVYHYLPWNVLQNTGTKNRWNTTENFPPLLLSLLSKLGRVWYVHRNDLKMIFVSHYLSPFAKVFITRNISANLRWILPSSNSEKTLSASAKLQPKSITSTLGFPPSVKIRVAG